MGSLRNRVIGSVSVLTLLAGTLVVTPVAAQPALALAAPGDQVVQVLGINDFHGRIANNTVEAGAAVLAGAVTQLRGEYPNTVFAAAGDLIGASTFESFIQQDKPTIDALNAAGLEVSAVGNHEFDQGFADLTDRVMAPYDPVTNPNGGAEWEYLGANVRLVNGDPALPESWIQTFGTGDTAVDVGFIGAVTDHLGELVNPDGLEGLTIEEPVVAANRAADQLESQGAEIIVLLVHEGAATTALESATDPASDFGEIVTGVDRDIDAIISGHTHLAYNHAVPVQQWIDEGRPVTTRPVVSAGQYGYNLNQLLFTVNTAGEVTAVEQQILPLVTTIPAVPPATSATYQPNYPADPAVAAIVTAAQDKAKVLGEVVLGEIAAPFNRSRVNATAPATGLIENRGGESTLGNLVAEVQQEATGAQIALMNPGGLRADMIGNAGDPATYPADLTFRQAANTQPFANTLVNMTLTGAQLKTVLEQQWQPAGASRPFLRLGQSAGFTYTYDPAAAAGSHITSITLDGFAIDPAASYSVTVNSFLAAGGDNFTEFAAGTDRQDTGQVDLESMVDYMDQDEPVAPDLTQRSIGVSFPQGAPTAYAPGDTVSFALSSWSFAAASDPKDAEVSVSVGGAPVGTFAVDNTIGTEILDEYGKAQISFVLPDDAAPGSAEIVVSGATTGTTLRLPLTVTAPPAPVATVTLTPSAPSQVYGSSDRVTLSAAVSSSTGDPVTGRVQFVADGTVLATRPLVNGVATYQLPARTPAGTIEVTARFTGSGSLPAAESAAVEITVAKATSAAALLATKTSYRQGAFLPAILFGAVVLDNGQRASGSVDIVQDGTVIDTVPLRGGVFYYLLPRSLGKGAYTFKATYQPSDPANVAGVDSNFISIQIR